MYKYFILIKVYINYHSSIALGILLSIVTLLTSIFILAISGWLIASSALAGTATIYTFNYMLPAASVRFASIIRTAGRWAERVVSHDATFRLLKNIRIYTFTRIIPLTPGILIRFNKVELMNKIVADVDTLNHLYLRVLSPLVSALIVILVITCVLSIIDLCLSMIICTVILSVFILFSPLLYYKSKYIGNKLTSLRASYRLQLTNWLKNNAELTVYGASNFYKSKLYEIEKRWQQYQRKNNIFLTSIQGILLLITSFTMIIILLLLDLRLIFGNSKQCVALFFFITLSEFEALVPVANSFNYLGQVIASAISINSLINLLPVVVFPIHGPVVTKSVSISIEKLQFNYQQLAEPAIKNFSINVTPGEHIAIIGHTGCGKSTLLQLLTRAWDPTIGIIKFNDLPLSQWSEKSLRSMTAIVPQRIHIFSATLRDNLCLAHNVKDKKIFNILEQLELDNLLKYEGLNTYLGEGGRLLSGGEQRRIGIARALLHDAPLLLLDEPTEGLDVNLEKRILEIILKFSNSRTLIMITHHLQGLDIMDRIYIMDRGSIIEQGNHLVLMNHRGRYYKAAVKYFNFNKLGDIN